MTKPRQRTATAIRLRPDLHARLAEAASERDVSINWLINRALEDFLPRLIPVDELVYVRGNPPPTRDTPHQPQPSTPPR